MIRALQSVSDAIDRIFHDRRVVLISETSTRQIRLSKGVQMGVVLSILLSLASLPFFIGQNNAKSYDQLVTASGGDGGRVESVESDILMLKEYIKALHKFDNFVIKPKEIDNEVDYEERSENIDDLEKKRNNLLKEVQFQAVNRIFAIENFMSSVGMDYKTITGKNPPNRENVGGPYIPASLYASEDDEDMMLTPEFITELNYLFELQKMMNYLPYSAPVRFDKVTSNYGLRRDPFDGSWAMHSGIDLVGKDNSYVVSSGPGIVIRAGRESGYGNMVEVYHGYGISTRYGHLKSITVKEKQRVERADIIGIQGCTGRCTGDHVHFEVRKGGIPINPVRFLSKANQIKYFYAKEIN